MHLRKQRGFAWERDVVRRLKNLGWSARRLGGSGMPDVIASGPGYRHSLIIECKSGYSDKLYVPLDQIKRQFEWVNEAILPNPESMLAFKFAEGKKPVVWFWIYDCPHAEGITCRKDGVISLTGKKTIVGRGATLEKILRIDL